MWFVDDRGPHNGCWEKHLMPNGVIDAIWDAQEERTANYRCPGCGEKITTRMKKSEGIDFKTWFAEVERLYGCSLDAIEGDPDDSWWLYYNEDDYTPQQAVDEDMSYA